MPDDLREHPVAERDYPRSWSQFLRWFPDDAACLTYLEQLRWRSGFRCPACGVAGEPWCQSRDRLTCSSCRHQASVTAGTIFHRTRTPLTSWFAAIWYVTGQKYGASALGLNRILGLGSYQTAWTMLHKLRRAMVRPDRDRLRGVVEVDETHMGSDTDPDGRKTESLVIVAIEVLQPRGFGRVRLRHIETNSTDNLIPFVREAIEPGTHVVTDGLAPYKLLPQYGYTHERRVVTDAPDPAHVLLPGVHRVAALLKRWLMGTHQGAVLPRHPDYYLDEYTFRFNRRTAKSRGLLFYRLLEHAVATAPTTYRSIVDGPPPAKSSVEEEPTG